MDEKAVEKGLRAYRPTVRYKNKVGDFHMSSGAGKILKFTFESALTQ